MLSEKTALEKKKLLLTGATGFIGSHILDAILEIGSWEILLVARHPNPRLPEHPDLTYIKSDLSLPDQIDRIARHGPFTHIIHCAGVKEDRKEQKFDANIKITETLIEIIKRSPSAFKQFIFISSLAAFGPKENASELIKINEPPHPISEYGKSKLVAERLITQSGLPYLIIRPTAVFGPKDKDFLPLFKLAKKGLCIFLASRDQTLTFIYIQDLVEIIMEGIHKNITYEAYFASDGRTYSPRDVKEVIEIVTNKKITAIFVPGPFLQIMINLAKISAHLLPFGEGKLRELSAKSWNCDLENFRQDFEFRPSFNLQAGMQSTYQWYRNNGFL